MRTSVRGDPEVKVELLPEGSQEGYQDSKKFGRLGLPEIVGVTEYRDIISVASQKAIEGEKSADVLAQA